MPREGWPHGSLPITVPNPAHAHFLGREAADPREEILTRILDFNQFAPRNDKLPDELERIAT